MRVLFFIVFLFLASVVKAAPIDFSVDSYSFRTDSSLGTFSVNLGTYSVTYGAITDIDYVSSFIVGADTVVVSGSFGVAPRLSLPTGVQIRSAIVNDLRDKRDRGEVTAKTNDAVERRTHANLRGVVGGVVGATVTVP